MSALPPLDEGLLRKTLDRVEELAATVVEAKVGIKPDESWRDTWVQDSWRCGSGMCYAGFAAEIAGGEWANAVPNYHTDDAYLVAESADEEYADRDFDLVRREGRRLVHVSDRAQRLLGLTPDESITLFYAHNDVQTLRDMVTALIEDRDGFLMKGWEV